MFDQLRTILVLAIQPLFIFWVLVLLAVIFQFRHKTDVVKKLLVCALCLLLVVSTAFLPNLLISLLENQYAPFNQEQTVENTSDHILVLGAGHISDPKLSANSKLTSNALGRLVEGIRIHGLIPDSKLVLSGGLGIETESQAEVLKATALILGVKIEDILTLNTTKNTADEAKQYKHTFGNQYQLILVTEAYHMPRAMMHFTKLGLNPIPAPANNIYKRGENIECCRWLTNSSNIYKTEIAIHEWAGMLWAKMSN